MGWRLRGFVCGTSAYQRGELGGLARAFHAIDVLPGCRLRPQRHPLPAKRRMSDRVGGLARLALKGQAGFGCPLFGGEIYRLQGRRADRVTLIRQDGLGMSPCAKRLKAGKFIGPRGSDAVVILAAQSGSLLDGMDWRA
jgi:hypothetical protein